MKAILEFNLEEPNDKVFHERCIKSLDLALCIHDMQEYLRSQYKYQTKPEPITQEKFYEFLEKYDINLGSIIL